MRDRSAHYHGAASLDYCADASLVCAGAFRDNVASFLAEFGDADTSPVAPGLRAWSVALRVPGSQARGARPRRARYGARAREQGASDTASACVVCYAATQGASGAHTLRVYEEAVQLSGRTHCDACRCVGARRRRSRRSTRPPLPPGAHLTRRPRSRQAGRTTP